MFQVIRSLTFRNDYKSTNLLEKSNGKEFAVRPSKRALDDGKVIITRVRS